MSGNVAVLKAAYGEYTDDIGQNIGMMWMDWDAKRQPKKAEWRELTEYIFATDTTTTSAGALPWKNSTTLPKLCQLRDNLHANYISALFPNDNWLEWVGQDLSDSTQAKKKAITAYIQNKCNESGFKEIVSRAVLDYIDYGNAMGNVEYVIDGFTDEFTGEYTTTYEGPKLRRNSPYDYVFNPTATDFTSSPIIKREIKTIGELELLAQQPDYSFWNDALKERKEFTRNLGAYTTSDIEKMGQYMDDGFGDWYSYFRGSFVEVLTFTGDWYDQEAGVTHKSREITVIDRCRVVEDRQIPSWLGKKHHFHTGWRKRPDNIYGMGPLDNLVGMQYRIDHLENLKADAMDLIVHPPLVVKGDVEPFQWGPNALIQVLDGDIGELGLGLQGVATADNQIAMLEAKMEEFAGAPKQAMGIRTPGEKTAFEVQALENAAGRIFQEKITQFEVEWLEPALNGMLECARRNLDVSDVVRVMDDDIGVEEFISVTKEDITARGRLRPMGARHFGQQAQTMQNLNQLLNGPMGQMVAPHISRKQLAKLIEDSLQLEQYKIIRPNVGVVEDAETQQLAQQGQQQTMTEAAVPPPGMTDAPPMG